MKKMTNTPKSPGRGHSLAAQLVVWGVLGWMALSTMAQNLANRADFKSEEGSSTLETAVIAAGLLAVAVLVVGAITLAVKSYSAKITGP